MQKVKKKNEEKGVKIDNYCLEKEALLRKTKREYERLVLEES